ncbi:unnamed protein product [Pelagomonas calceolata]|uniref:MYND-type domain-containing protein n=1 Tax=Pelagomonas calceolata TaxID=35677 RepID=A0A8J2SN63_9STRA|nr:unnamed protein product [Pelagomonas calceolata]
MAALAAALPTAHNDDDADDSDDDGYEDDFVDPEDYTDDDFQSVDTADEDPDYDPKLPEVADAKLPVPRRPRRAALAAAAPRASAPPAPAPAPVASAAAPASSSSSSAPPQLIETTTEAAEAPAPAPAPLTNYDKWDKIDDAEQGSPPSPVDHAGALPAMRVSERDDGGVSFDFTTMQPEANDDLVTLNPLGGDDVDENEKPGIYRRATPDEAPRPPPAPRVLGVCSSSTCSKDATLRCGVCKVAKYCSVICQRRDWKLHKAVCAPIRSEKAGTHLRTSAE